MTDITELAKSLKAAAMEATLEKWYVDNDFDVCSENYGFVAELHGDNLVHNAQFIAVANPANILSLVEALEKAQKMETYWKTQCRGITDHCEQLQAHIAELEESHAQVIQSRDHYKRMLEEGLEQLAESRTVKLPKPISVLHRRDFTDAHRAIYAYPEAEVNAALASASIKWEAE